MFEGLESVVGVDPIKNEEKVVRKKFCAFVIYVQCWG